MSKLYPYQDYKPSNLSFIDKLPIDWKILRGKFVFREINERSVDGKEQLLSVSEHKGVVPRDSINVTMFRAEDYSGYKLCNPGDVVINSIWAWHRGIGVAEHRGIVSTAYSVHRLKKPNEWNYKFLNYLLRTDAYVGEYLIRSKGIWDSRLQLTGSNFQDIPIIIPPLETQTAIAAYLDIKTQQIQEFIVKKKRLIELLQDRRKTEIHKLITQGTKNNISFVSTSLKWFEIIPEHWKLKKLKHFADHVQRGSSPEYVNDNGIPVVSQAVFSGGFIDEAKFKLQRKQKIETFKGRLYPNDVLVASTGGGVLGKSFLFETEGDYIADGHVTIIRDSKKRFVPAFLYYIFSINFDLIEGFLGQGSTNQTEIQREWFRNMLFPFPPIDEQEEIVNTIKKIDVDINRLIIKAKVEIDKAKEYQESLITQVVTGQLKVPRTSYANLENNIEFEMVAE
jgi:type I restriction enzyme S subunit